MLTCLITILTLLVSLETLVKREPLNTASLDTGYKSISEDRKQQPESRPPFTSYRKFRLERHDESIFARSILLFLQPDQK